ncbi:hypothetical protein L227DRAFT_394992 [Lentinus tigrinus ALCF2SS1-6]|uniref:Uncharacterized protein n=1 Tax=Lentinus tigrinus ALCF2SS1-6 TaxID=1328759 RepID=A0A5C2SII3_9APHY|nr:hypothetical protein L227DRAFT_394992 [Lentinus tigrinus ALCF2SS1-6]
MLISAQPRCQPVCVPRACSCRTHNPYETTAAALLAPLYDMQHRNREDSPNALTRRTDGPKRRTVFASGAAPRPSDSAEMSSKQRYRESRDVRHEQQEQRPRGRAVPMRCPGQTAKRVLVVRLGIPPSAFAVPPCSHPHHVHSRKSDPSTIQPSTGVGQLSSIPTLRAPSQGQKRVETCQKQTGHAVQWSRRRIRF